MKFAPRSEATRQLIIEKTAELFNKQGFAGTSITDVEKATHLTKGSIYGNFLNKEEVALAVFDYNLQQLRETVREKVEQREGAKEKLLAYIDVYAGLNAESGG